MTTLSTKQFWRKKTWKIIFVIWFILPTGVDQGQEIESQDLEITNLDPEITNLDPEITNLDLEITQGHPRQEQKNVKVI